MIYLFTGPAPLAQLVREELLNRGIGADLHSRGPLAALYGAALAGSGGFQSVVVTEETAERHRAAIEEVLALVSPAEPSEMAPAVAPRSRGSEPAPGADRWGSGPPMDCQPAPPTLEDRPRPRLRLPWRRRDPDR